MKTRERIDASQLDLRDSEEMQRDRAYLDDCADALHSDGFKAGGALSANKNATSYPDDVSKRSAAVLSNAKSFVFDASDGMPTAMNDAFWKQMVALTNGSTTVDKALSDLDAVQKDAYTT